MNYLLCETDRKGFNASSKARNDTIHIAEESGFKLVSLYKSKSNKIHIMYSMINSIVNVVNNATENEYILIQYPYQPMAVNTLILKLLNIGKKVKNFQTIILIHDISSLRDEIYTGTPSRALKDELRFLTRFDHIICHNEKMEKVFIDNGFGGKFKNLELFDYLSAKTDSDKKNEKNTIVIAGNLSREKCSYIYDLPEVDNIKYNLYGIGFENTNNASINYKGAFPSEKIVDMIEGGFGLVWDGTSIDSCNGNYGNYLRYNNPHKFSLYMASCIPVIVWNQSALSSFVEENKIGLSVQTINQAIQMINSMDENEYNEMVNNVKVISKRVTTGHYLGKCLKEICNGRV